MTDTTHRSATRNWARRLLAGAVVAAIASPFGASFAAATVTAPVRAGDVTVVDPNIQSDPITHGNAATQFSVRLPDKSTCPGDSANDQWRVQSFIIPANEDPVAIRYGAIGPEPVGNGRYALFLADTTPYVHQLTQRNPAKGSPGIISAIPALTFSVIAGEKIPDGTYRIGVACTYFGKTAEYWDTQIVISGSGVTAGKLSWRLADVPATVRADQGSNRSAAIVVVLAAFGFIAVALGVYFWRGRLTTLSKEHS